METNNLFSFEVVDLSAITTISCGLSKYDGCGGGNGQCTAGCGCGKDNGSCGATKPPIIVVKY